ncbi:aminopeptidase [Peptoniphilus mikwangii]|uniref:aminopeptidase n=1 Tax=Peptoniphilus mikwangii TaxID=1354300 RepID=UPI00041BCBB1|nr:aminopeptidase [Peptoniphilus mikwangii]
MSFKENLKKYANLIIREGLKIKKDDLLVIRGPVETYEFINLIAETAFEAGAKDVFVNYSDQNLAKIRYNNASIETLSDIPQYFIDEQNGYIEKKAKFLSITGDDPNLLSDVNPEKVKAAVKAKSIALKSFSEKMMNSECSWCVVGVAVPSWAKVVFPNLSEEEAVKKLWDTIFYTVRVTEDNPISAWETHSNNLKKWSDFLNEKQFEFLEYHSENGTDLKIRLPENHIFSGASEFNRYGEEFIANMPTEEVFSMPHRDGVNGIVYNTKPLNYNGNLIDDFYLKFKDGVVVDFDAKIGYETLKNMLDSDEGSRRLGEVALVPYHSPISNTKILFYNTLYDENASCHLALGKAYPICIKGGESMSTEELIKNGANDSIIHVDFMIGDSTTNIVGISKSGERTQIFKDGNFVI